MKGSIMKYVKQIIQILFILLVLFLTILFHELGHVIAIIQCGGEIVDFQVELFSGVVYWKGVVTLEQYQYIALNGCIFSIIIMSILFLALHMMKARILTTFSVGGIVMQTLYLADVDNVAGYGGIGSDINHFLMVTPEVNPEIVRCVFNAITIILTILVIIYICYYITKSDWWRKLIDEC